MRNTGCPAVTFCPCSACRTLTMPVTGLRRRVYESCCSAVATSAFAASRSAAARAMSSLRGPSRSSDKLWRACSTFAVATSTWSFAVSSCCGGEKWSATSFAVRSCCDASEAQVGFRLPQRRLGAPDVLDPRSRLQRRQRPFGRSSLRAGARQSELVVARIERGEHRTDLHRLGPRRYRDAGSARGLEGEIDLVCIDRAGQDDRRIRWRGRSTATICRIRRARSATPPPSQATRHGRRRDGRPPCGMGSGGHDRRYSALQLRPTGHPMG